MDKAARNLAQGGVISRT